MTSWPNHQWWPSAGWLSVLVHNYGGRFKKQWKNDQIRELLTEYPAHIMVLQEHSKDVLTEEDRSHFHVCYIPKYSFKGEGITLVKYHGCC